MRENRPYGSEGGGPQPNAASLPLSLETYSDHDLTSIPRNVGIGRGRSDIVRLIFGPNRC